MSAHRAPRGNVGRALILAGIFGASATAMVLSLIGWIYFLAEVFG